MSKLSQCAKCVKDRRNCGQYIPEDMDCPQYVSAREDDGENAFAQKVGIGYTTFYVGFVYVIFTIGLANYFENPMVYYIFSIPIILLVIWGIVKYMINRKKRKSMKTNKEEMEQIRITLPDSSTRTSLMVTLRKLNLQYEFDGNQNIMVTYQGEVIRIIAENDSYWLHIQDCW